MYRITIEWLEVTEWQEEERVVIDERPYTDKELQEANLYFRTLQEKGEVDLKKIYDTRIVDKRKEQWKQVYQQITNELHVRDVVKSVLEHGKFAE